VTKSYGKITEGAGSGYQQYVKEVKEGTFPDDDHTYGVDDKIFEEFATLVEKRKQI
ncbi:MAG: 3-methyl-2-oxobutanoate hydroxymethyltransferase, partial [Rhodospirillaceae bacterium]|nr:3-methyl-2-oxobutanoate hydroxymethyltransferase [Rhodospirillaceae bacterium]